MAPCCCQLLNGAIAYAVCAITAASRSRHSRAARMLLIELSRAVQKLGTKQQLKLNACALAGAHMHAATEHTCVCKIKCTNDLALAFHASNR
jgi:hypothetical protein